ncbi:hypothetical protein UA08_06753 [Talaromyces atroroseus]|uniref:Carboxylic ester hydrolase n=1 Tax=Talaromyces atroroseus TaxID=1441469 RepID=A0A225ARS3_TALAT|nr:hypothetical protein UA08_06753 [Talaromyces atroroseus]OKL58279.1 hypothetical protein UA08_06753 [Talaromyces atroroseus]
MARMDVFKGGHENNQYSSAVWAQLLDGQLNIPLFTDFASVSLNDIAVIGKQISSRYYGYGPSYSYWNGCSTGGRQGLMMTQKYSQVYNGIYTGSPAINWPVSCVFDAISDAAVEAWGSLNDRVIAKPGQCLFDPAIMVGQRVNCNGTLVNITSDDATIVQKTWEGPRTADGTPLWVLEDAGVDLKALTLDEFVGIFYQVLVKYKSLIGTNNIDLHPSHYAGGKMITWHGLADQLIFPGGTIDYYRKVLGFDDTVHGYYRFFSAPGVSTVAMARGRFRVIPSQLSLS